MKAFTQNYYFRNQSKYKRYSESKILSFTITNFDGKNIILTDSEGGSKDYTLKSFNILFTSNPNYKKKLKQLKIWKQSS